MAKQNTFNSTDLNRYWIRIMMINLKSWDSEWNRFLKCTSIPSSSVQCVPLVWWLLMSSKLWSHVRFVRLPTWRITKPAFSGWQKRKQSQIWKLPPPGQYLLRLPMDLSNSKTKSGLQKAGRPKKSSLAASTHSGFCLGRWTGDTETTWDSYS